MNSKMLTLALLLAAVGANAQISCGDIADQLTARWIAASCQSIRSNAVENMDRCAIAYRKMEK